MACLPVEQIQPRRSGGHFKRERAYRSARWLARGAGLKAPRISRSEPLYLCRHRRRAKCSRRGKWDLAARQGWRFQSGFQQAMAIDENPQILTDQLRRYDTVFPETTVSQAKSVSFRFSFRKKERPAQPRANDQPCNVASVLPLKTPRGFPAPAEWRQPSRPGRPGPRSGSAAQARQRAVASK